MHRKLVADITLPLSEYAIVDSGATLAQALLALNTAQKNLSPGKQPHRAVLIKNKTGEIIGKLGHLAFLRALLPEEQTLREEDLLARAGVSGDMKAISKGVWEFLDDDSMNIPSKAQHIKVVDVCSSVSESIRHDAPLVEAIRMFVSHQTLSLLVRENKETIGILRLVDLFDEIASQIDLDNRIGSERNVKNGKDPID